ncbi:NADPH-dependent F420 reductase [Streptomyces qinzhouensis]|uniref:NADP oxidoreductase coenzyme F420-dependent n=1 Tax=Streptomyces qinzhouensis TaxID=2599401 RepID=A0A5B8IJJ5_9ACTN|nr:NAD(P)-binding domain-containing protein [Streptomyces qinzhouensis]QDY77559.1 NADP oxidoreductase coenzyme F420-dependent [Streptomyces qinzhouensis]
MTTAIIGMGNIGGRLAANLARGGEPLLLASREPQDAVDTAARLGDGTRAVTVDEAVERADVLVLAVWFETIKELIASWGDRLDGKIVVDPSNPIAVDDKGAFSKTLPEDQSSGAVIASLLPDGARLVKAFGTLTANTLTDAAHRTPPRAAEFYATDDPAAGDTVARLITAGGYDPVPVGGIDQSIRIEVFGDLHESGLGTTLTAEEAAAKV